MNTKTNKNQRFQNVFRTRSLTVIAMLSAVAVVLMLFEIPLWFAPFFYELDFSEVPVLIGAFALGPVAGIIIELVKVLLNLVINGTDTVGIGELANFMIGCSMVVPAALIYQKKKSRKSAIIGLLSGTAIMTAIGSVLNAFVLLPVYAYFYGAPLDSLIKMGTEVNPGIQNLSTFVLFAVVPFNLFKGTVVSIITILLYKRLSIIIKSVTK
jgi:riboflavin transporter FmnP